MFAKQVFYFHDTHLISKIIGFLFSLFNDILLAIQCIRADFQIFNTNSLIYLPQILLYTT